MAFIDNLSRLIHNTPENTQTLIENITRKGGNPAFIGPYFDKLPLVKVVVDGQLVAGKASTPDALNLTGPKGKGQFSNVYRNTKDPFVYKVIHDYTYSWKGRPYERYCFKEIIIQTLLQSDPEKGDAICKLEAVYRTDKDIILKLERLKMPLKEWFKELEKQDPRTPYYTEAVKNSMIKVLELVDYFNKKYEFHHYDLHADNIMLDSNSNFKLVDFGWDSYVKIGDNKIDFLNASADDAWRLVWSVQKEIPRYKLSRDFNVLLDSLNAVGHYLTLSKALEDLGKFKAVGGSKSRKSRSKRLRRTVKYKI